MQPIHQNLFFLNSIDVLWWKFMFNTVHQSSKIYSSLINLILCCNCLDAIQFELVQTIFLDLVLSEILSSTKEIYSSSNQLMPICKCFKVSKYDAKWIKMRNNIYCYFQNRNIPIPRHFSNCPNTRKIPLQQYQTR